MKERYVIAFASIPMKKTDNLTPASENSCICVKKLVNVCHIVLLSYNGFTGI